ncbi:MAG: putative pre-rRNA-processing protein ESF2, partial [Streblomastix strix]
EDKSGVLYIARVPMFMKVATLRNILSQYGEIGRIFLNEERKEQRSKRLKAGGNHKKRYVDGWIEFRDKHAAKSVAISLNNTQIGGKIRFYADDIWNLKYLPKMKWRHLIEKINEQNADKEEFLRKSTKDARKRAEDSMEKIDKSARIKHFQKKHQAKKAMKPSIIQTQKDKDKHG